MIRVVDLDGRRIVLVGTAHVSRESAELVRRVIETESPDRVCVELDEQRFEALSKRQRWENLDLKQLIKQKQLATLLVNLLLASFQKKLGDGIGVPPGTELLEATTAAAEQDIPVTLADRPVRITLLRAWRSMGLWQRARLSAELIASTFGDVKISEEDLRRLKNVDVLNELMAEMASQLPTLKRVLIDERDLYLADRIRNSEGQRIVAVVGAGHLQGIVETLARNPEIDLDEISKIPKSPPWGRVLAWSIPALIIAAIITIGWTQGARVAGENMTYWFLANGIPSALGAVLALAHPLTILAAFVAAPFTSLNPMIGAGYVTAFVQTWVAPPRVRDFQSVVDEASKITNWWKNRVLRVLLAFILPMIGSVIGTWIGGLRIFRNLVGGS